MRKAKILIRLGGSPGWSQSLLVAQVILLVLSVVGSNIMYTSCILLSTDGTHKRFKRQEDTNCKKEKLRDLADSKCLLSVFYDLYCTHLLRSIILNLSEALRKSVFGGLRKSKTQSYRILEWISRQNLGILDDASIGTRSLYRLGRQRAL